MSGPIEDMTVDVTRQGGVDDAVAAHAAAELSEVSARSRELVRALQVRIVHEPDPARARPWRVEAVLDVDGWPVRAHMSAATPGEAVDLVRARLARRLQRHEDKRHRLPERRRSAGTGHEWRHGDPPTPRTEYFDRPAEEREVVRQKTALGEPATVDEAAFDRDMLDHAFYLFTDAATGSDSLIWVDDSGELHVGQTSPDARCVQGAAAPVQLDENPAPRLSVSEARERLDVGHERFVFFADAGSGVGSVLYRRYDGHYGLITAR